MERSEWLFQWCGRERTNVLSWAPLGCERLFRFKNNDDDDDNDERDEDVNENETKNKKKKKKQT